MLQLLFTHWTKCNVPDTVQDTTDKEGIMLLGCLISAVSLCAAISGMCLSCDAVEVTALCHRQVTEAESQQQEFICRDQLHRYNIRDTD